MALWTAIAVAGVTLAGAQTATSCDQGSTLLCEQGEPVGDLGIDALRCNCTVNAQPGRRSWSFRDAPEVRGVDPDGPAAGRLEPGDVLTALDGVAITRSEAGERFANLAPHELVRLTIRRDGRERTVEITTAAICPEDEGGLEHVTPLPSAAPVASSGGEPRALPAVPSLPPSMPTGWFGLGLQCRDCGWQQESGESLVVWHFQAAPVVYRVDPDGPAAEAGIRAGDTVLMIDGVPLVTEDGGRRFGAVQPGDRARLTVGRVGARETVLVTAERAPTVSSAPPGGTPAPDSPAPAPAPARNPRYQGSVGNAQIEVLGTGAVIVNVPAPGREVEIITGDATIRIRAPEHGDR
jgi:hypothetical protein